LISRTIRLLAISLLTFCFAGISSASVQKIGPDLYAYISENDGSANSTFLVSDRGILVVDTGLNAQEGRKLLDEIRKISSAPVRWIVNTHYHADHRGGNHTVGPDAVIISTEQTFTVAWNLDEQAYKGERGGGTNRPLAEVFSTFHGPVFFVGGHEVRLYYPGPAHTMGDAVVYFPDQQAIATGDLFLNNSCPAMDRGDLENWIVALDSMLRLPVEHAVPGHFALGTKSELQDFRDYLADLRDQVKRMYQQGLNLEQIQKKLDLSAYKGLRQFPQYEATFKDNAATYYKQLEEKKLPRTQIR